MADIGKAHVSRLSTEKPLTAVKLRPGIEMSIYQNDEANSTIRVLQHHTFQDGLTLLNRDGKR